jgi:hypothetical protein
MCYHTISYPFCQGRQALEYEKKTAKPFSLVPPGRQTPLSSEMTTSRFPYPEVTTSEISLGVAKVGAANRRRPQRFQRRDVGKIADAHGYEGAGTEYQAGEVKLGQE